mmetsp:Transcript_25605/g.63535  ORF Transcript_25605/g.63535 Transcript_25605/m.63535 type:complete len:232 (+) Transcript_25605:277-972(+)
MLSVSITAVGMPIMCCCKGRSRVSMGCQPLSCIASTSTGQPSYGNLSDCHSATPSRRPSSSSLLYARCRCPFGSVRSPAFLVSDSSSSVRTCSRLDNSSCSISLNVSALRGWMNVSCVSTAAQRYSAIDHRVASNICVLANRSSHRKEALFMAARLIVSVLAFLLSISPRTSARMCDATHIRVADACLASASFAAMTWLSSMPLLCARVRMYQREKSATVPREEGRPSAID